MRGLVGAPLERSKEVDRQSSQSNGGGTRAEQTPGQTLVSSLPRVSRHRNGHIDGTGGGLRDRWHRVGREGGVVAAAGPGGYGLPRD